MLRYTVCAVVWVLVLTKSTPADGTKVEHFADVVEAQFAKWDRNHDGKLTALEVDAVVKDQNVTGSAAAAAAAIHCYFRRKGAPESIGKAELLKDPKSDDSGRRDQNGGAGNIPGTYRTFHHHLSTVPRKVFAKPEAPQVAGMTQGNVGDCFLISGLGAAVNRNPEVLRKLLREHPDGSCEVTFPGARTIRVPKLTEAEICLGSSAGDQGLWLNVFEKGLGEFMASNVKAPKNPKDIELDKINHGGDPAQVLRYLTAHQIATVSLGGTKKPHTETQLSAMQAQLHKIMQVAAVEKDLMCCGTGTGSNQGKLPHGVISDHAYAVVGYDHSKQMVHVWNPWGSNYNVKLKPGQTPGLENGYEVTNGLFAIPLHDFVRVFEEFHYESRNLAKKK